MADTLRFQGIEGERQGNHGSTLSILRGAGGGDESIRNTGRPVMKGVREGRPADLH